MCHDHATPATIPPLVPAVMDLQLAHDEWRRSRTRDEQIWSNGQVVVLLTTSRRIEIRLGRLMPYTAQVRKRADYLEAKRAAIRVAQSLAPKAQERAALLLDYRYPGERPEAEAQARLFLLD